MKTSSKLYFAILFSGLSIEVACSSEDQESSFLASANSEVSSCASGMQNKTDSKGVKTCWIETLNEEKGVCDRDYRDECCKNTQDTCGSMYEGVTNSYLQFSSHSNGACTGGGSGTGQCALFVQQFYREVLKHYFRAGWYSAQNSLESIDPRALNKDGTKPATDLQSNIDPVFIFRVTDVGWTGAQESPRETDALVFSGGNFGHIVIASQLEFRSDDSLWISIIEENVAKLVSYGPSGSGASCHHRVLLAKKNDDGKWIIDSGIGAGFKYAGFIRHNLAGIYPDIGWHDDGMSQKFRDAYLAVANGSSGKSLGWAFSDHGGTPFVHDIRGVTLQNFVNTNPDNRYGTDGETALVVSPSIGVSGSKSVYLLKEGFWGAYKCIPGSDGKAMGGAEYLGAPQSEEKQGQIDGNCQVISNAGAAIPTVTYQLFEKGCMWWWKDEVDTKVHVHLYSGTLIDAEKATACGVKVENNPPSADCSNDCTPGTQQCLGSSQIQICGHPGPDSCYHWLTLSCASGTTCSNNACVSSTSSTVGIATASTGGATSFGGSSSTGIKNCAQSARRCPSNSNQYQICILDTYSGATDWMSFDCPSGQSCQTNTGICGVSTATSVSTGGSSSTGGASSVIVSSSGGSSLGGSSSQGGSITTTNLNASGSSSTVSIASISSGGVVSTSSSNSSSTGGVGLTTSILSADVLHIHYAGPVTGRHILKGWWNALNGTSATWDNAFASRGCEDANIMDNAFDCDISIPSGVQDVLFQMNLPDGRYWGDMSYDSTGGQGATIGTLALTKGSMTLNYEMKANPEGSLYFMGHLPVVP